MHRLARRRCGALAAAACATLAAAPAAGAAGPCAPGPRWGTAHPALARAVVGRVNLHRLDTGIPQLAIDPALTRAAVWKSLHMARYAYFAHDDPAPPVRRTPFQRMRACGFPSGRAMGENIAAGYGTAALVVRGWLASPGHRANIESRAFRLIGVGAATRRGSRFGVYWTQDFGGASGGVGRPPRAVPDRTRTAPRTSVAVDVRANDRDPEGGPLQVIGASDAEGGRVAVIRGRVRYRPAAGFTGTGGFRYAVMDASGMVARGRATVVVR